MTNAEINALGTQLSALRNVGDQAVVVSLGSHGPDGDMADGCLCATVTVGGEEGFARAKYLCDAISLARGEAMRKVAAKKAKAEAEAKAKKEAKYA